LSELTGIDKDNPTGCSDTSFLGVCNPHDDCYQGCGNNKDTCDSDFFEAMTDVCTGSSCASSCFFYARAYYGAVHNYGNSAWQDDKVKACDCYDCN
jgi:hypothetical protein